jgi:type IV secretory pathway VirB3-like protein
VANHNRSEICFLALTRPSLVRGVPVECLAANVLVTFLSGLWLSAPTIWRSPIMFWLAGIPIHVICQRLTSRDWHWARTFRLWSMTVGTGRTVLHSLPTQPPTKAGDIPTSG